LKNLDSIYFAARELPPEARLAYLTKACEGDPVLRARVEQMLAVADEAEAFITDLPDEETVKQKPGGEPLNTVKAEPADLPDEVLGQKIGRYKILERVGEGGCGVVYVAEQTEPVRRRVALKVIKLGMDTKAVVARFEAERQALAMMDHPNIAKVLDGGATDNGRPYFIMELVRGIKITDYCDQANLTTTERLNLFIKVCQAIQHAHQKGIIHRDIKPSNILVTVNDGLPVPKVIDFGIAKATEGRLTEATVYTQLHQFIGTPAYMSPEQAEMSSLDIDTRSDIYSLGVLLYELLAGRTPFDARELLSQGIDAMRKRIREEEPMRPSTRFATLQGEESTTTAKRRSVDKAKLVHQLQGDLDWIVMKCLEKDRTRRYETANGLATDLKRHLSNEPVLARSPSALYRFQKAVWRNKLAFAAGTAMAALLILGIAASLWQAGRANREAGRALRAEAAANERLAEAQAVSKFMTGVFQSPDPTRDGRTITVAETLDRAATNLEHELAAQPGVRAQLQSTLGATYQALGLYPEAIQLQKRVRDYYLTTLGPEHPATLAATHDLANSYSSAGRGDEALKLQEEVLALYRKVLGPEHPATLGAMNNLASSYYGTGHRGEGLKLRQEVLALRRKVNGPEDPDTLKAMGNLAISYTDSSRRDEALKLREEVLATSRKVLGLEHPETLTAMLNLAVSYYETGRRDEALKLRQEVMPLYRKVLGPEHPETLTAMLNLAVSYYDTGRRDEALKLQDEMLHLSRKVNGPEHPATLAAMQDLARSYSDAGRGDAALKLHEEVLLLQRKVLGPEHPDALAAMNNLAISYGDAGRRDEALKLREEVLTLRRKVSGPEDPDTLRAMSNLANSYGDTGRRDEALKLRQEVLPLYRKLLGPEHPDTLHEMVSLASSYADTGREDEASGLAEKALALYRKVLGPEHPQTLGVMNNLADSYNDAGRRGEALTLREEALTLSRKVLGPEPPDTLSTMNDLAWALATSDAATIRNGTNAVQLAEAAVAATSRKNPDYLDTLAAAYAETQRFDKAVAVEREAIALYHTEPQKKEAGSHLSLYQANKPYREQRNP
jgi:tetratricopeptide (TPR) repeat protein